MSRRRAPRPASGAFRAALGQAAPQTPLAALQACWAEAVGERVAAVSQPVSERSGTAVMRCSDPVWAEELELMQEQLIARLREHLGERAPQRLRFRVGEDEVAVIFSRDLQGFCDGARTVRAAGTGILMSTCFNPDPRPVSCGRGRGFL